MMLRNFAMALVALAGSLIAAESALAEIEGNRPEATPAVLTADEFPDDGIPKELSVKDVSGIVKGAEITGQGCGGSNWIGKSWSFFFTSYKDVTVPWSKEPQSVLVGVVSGGEPEERHIIMFEGKGFRFRRPDSKPILERVKAEK